MSKQSANPLDDLSDDDVGIVWRDVQYYRAELGERTAVKCCFAYYVRPQFARTPNPCAPFIGMDFHGPYIPRYMRRRAAEQRVGR